MYGSRVKETTTTTGTGSLTLAGAVTGFATVNATFSNDTSDAGIPFQYFVIHENGTEWEAGIGHLTTSTALSRDVIEITDGGGATARSFSAGTKYVVATPIGRGIIPMAPKCPEGSSSSYRIRGSLLWQGGYTTNTLSADTLYLVPYCHWSFGQIDAIAYDCTSGAAGNIVCGIYTVAAATGLPGRLLQTGSAGAVTAAPASGVSTFTARYLPPGWYYLAANMSSAAPTYVTINASRDATGAAWLTSNETAGPGFLGTNGAGEIINGFSKANVYTGALPVAPAVTFTRHTMNNTPALALRFV